MIVNRKYFEDFHVSKLKVKIRISFLPNSSKILPWLCTLVPPPRTLTCPINFCQSAGGELKYTPTVNSYFQMFWLFYSIWRATKIRNILFDVFQARKTSNLYFLSFYMVLKYKSMVLQLFWIQILRHVAFFFSESQKKYMYFNLLQSEKNFKKYGLDDFLLQKAQKAWI